MKTRRELERELKRLQARATRRTPGRARRNPADPRALRELDALLQAKGDTFAWMLENAPDGTLEAAWDAADDPVGLLGLYAHTGDRRGLARAAAAVARRVVGFAGGHAQYLARSLAVAEAWSRGSASHGEVHDAWETARRISFLTQRDAVMHGAANAVVNALDVARDLRGSDLAAGLAVNEAIHAESIATRRALYAVRATALALVRRELGRVPTLAEILR